MTRLTSIMRSICSSFGVFLLACNAGAQNAGADTRALPLPDRPHPVIMEVLYDVPSRDLGGDANLDAMRSSVGDEFVELMNPHDEPINLKGYRIEDGQVLDHARLVFTFPDFVLPPGEVVVVFNGARADEIPGDDGSPDAAPTIRNPHFGDGWVFSMRMPNTLKAFANRGDIVFLIAPDGEIVEAVWWGETPQNPPRVARSEPVPTDPQMSVQRLAPTGPMIKHAEIDGERYSPGRIPDAHADARQPTTEEKQGD